MKMKLSSTVWCPLSCLEEIIELNYTQAQVNLTFPWELIFIQISISIFKAAFSLFCFLFLYWWHKKVLTWIIVTTWLDSGNRSLKSEHLTEQPHRGSAFSVENSKHWTKNAAFKMHPLLQHPLPQVTAQHHGNLHSNCVRCKLQTAFVFEKLFPRIQSINLTFLFLRIFKIAKHLLARHFFAMSLVVPG